MSGVVVKGLAMTVLLAVCVVLSPVASSAADMDRGRELYGRYCAWCHGENGDGQGPAAPYLNPPPRDFTFGFYKWRSTPFEGFVPTDGDFMRTIGGMDGHAGAGIPGWRGLAGTSMPGWSDVLTKGEILDIAAWIKDLAYLGEPEFDEVSVAGKTPPTPEALEEGRRIYGELCSECHGRAGRGDGEKKLRDDWGARTWPRNLTKGWTFRMGSTVEEIYRRITIGIPGTQMPSFADPASKKVLTEDERWAVAHFVRSLDEPYKLPVGDTVVRATRVGGVLPAGPDDPRWDRVPWTSLFFVPQLMEGGEEERLYKPTLDTISVKALYNGQGLALLLEWDDRTESVPGVKRAEDIADGEVYRDAVAVQFPSALTDSTIKPRFAMGDARRPVNIWTWKGPGSAGGDDEYGVVDARGTGEVSGPRAGGLRAAGEYDRGTWRVVMTRPLKTRSPEADIQLVPGRFIPVAFAAWDGSNRDIGSRHVLTPWCTIILEEEATGLVYAWPFIVAAVVFVLELLAVAMVKKD